MLSHKLLKAQSCSLILKRGAGKNRFNWYDEGIQYHGFKYYPKDPNFKDPPYEPSKLFRVKRIRPMKHLPYYEKTILTEFKLDGKDYAIVKNIPENNARLWRVKHAVEITPITFPDGFPKETDRTILKENGELRIIKNVNNLEKRVELCEQFAKLPQRLDGDTLRRNLRKKWLNGFESVV